LAKSENLTLHILAHCSIWSIHISTFRLILQNSSIPLLNIPYIHICTQTYIFPPSSGSQLIFILCPSPPVQTLPIFSTIRPPPSSSPLLGPTPPCHLPTIPNTKHHYHIWGTGGGRGALLITSKYLGNFYHSPHLLCSKVEKA
jgi:hypothetical protein